MFSHRQVLNHLRHEGDLVDKVVVLVATKCDLARSRIISSSVGKDLAQRFGVKYIETSSGVGHNVDELLVGIVTQLDMRGREGEEGEKRKSSLDQVADIRNRMKNMFDRVKNKTSTKLM